MFINCLIRKATSGWFFWAHFLGTQCSIPAPFVSIPIFTEFTLNISLELKPSFVIALKQQNRY